MLDLKLTAQAKKARYETSLSLTEGDVISVILQELNGPDTEPYVPKKKLPKTVGECVWRLADFHADFGLVGIRGFEAKDHPRYEEVLQLVSTLFADAEQDDK